jgi:hypothetical protein
MGEGVQDETEGEYPAKDQSEEPRDLPLAHNDSPHSSDT